jgi:hypothetical protein
MLTVYDVSLVTLLDKLMALNPADYHNAKITNLKLRIASKSTAIVYMMAANV